MFILVPILKTFSATGVVPCGVVGVPAVGVVDGVEVLQALEIITNMSAKATAIVTLFLFTIILLE